ncbi:TonB-dependent siderophore receptor [Pseudomonas helleri]|uniref:TonB-dependent siderophore receptor n=1 Tax=Pseudomonas helleri TaxID=1608996 RepID=A0A6G1W8S7_9PSED|nr:TonB-dependent siderophore receptor [Pseudomonas helleri]MQT27429.1 TonB-dependent siderophore receptor [Pseudomonas helleri]MQU16413.1 TonB-dependent siderophore receptor [Pseudomonas helleri]MQU27997.1 TonB-dependent siderophore receptor [Pseudomonas helleri]
MQRPHLSRTPLSIATQRQTVRRTLLSSALVASVLLGSSMAQAAPVALNIPSQSLASALNEFGKQANLQVLYSPDQVQGITSRGVSGSLEPVKALETLLQGSGISYQLNGDTVILNAPQGKGLELGATTISGQGLGTSLTTEDTGSYTTGATNSSTKLPLSIRETPQTVTVVTRQNMDDQGAQSIGDVLRNAPGISTQAYDSDRMEYSARGYAITNYQFDGVNSMYDGVFDEGATKVDMALYDRVDIVKGATGLLSGSGEPSATVNMIRKKPTREFKASITGSVGSWDNYRTEGDISGPLNEDGSVRGRLVGVYQDADSYIDHYSRKNDVFYGIIEADLTPDTTLTFGMDYQNIKPRGSSWTGNPYYFSDYSKTDFSRSFNPATDWSRRDVQAQTTFASLEHRFANDWKIKGTLNQQTNDHDTQLGSASGGMPDPVTGEGMFFYWGKWEGHRVQTTADINASGPFTLFGREHELVVGYTSQDSRQTGATFDGSLFEMVPGSIFDWNGHYPEPNFPKNGKYETNQNQNSAYIAARFRPTDDLSLILGTRVSDFQYNSTYKYYEQTSTFSDNKTTSKQHGRVTPYAGVVYDINDTYSAYASYTSIYKPVTDRSITGTTLAPTEGNSYEMGLKAEYFDGRLNASVAAFRTEQKKLPIQVGTNPNTNEGIYESLDGATTKGIEFELTGEVMRDWNVIAGYTYAQTKSDDGERVYGYPLETTKPENVAKLFTTYRLPGVLNKVTVGGGVNWQSPFYGKIYNDAKGDYDIIEQHSYALVNLMTRYEYNDHLTFNLNADNVFDKKYLSGLGNFNTTYYGAPRSLMLTTKYTF